MSNQGASRSGTLATLLCTHREKTGLTQRQLAGNGTSGLRVEVLGPLAVWRDGLPVPLGPVRQRAVLGLLILHAGTSVHRAAIIDALWGEDPPPTVVAMVHNHVSRIRRLVSGPPGGDVPLLWDGSGYRFIPGSIQLDVTQFGELTGQAEAQLAVGDAASACDLYERALALWRGQPLEDIEVLYAQPSVTKLGHWRDDVVIKYANAAARVGLHDRAIPHLEALTAREPLDERAHAQLMLALAATGRQAAALGVYQDLAGRLDTELGVRPGPESSAAHLRILREQVSPWAGAGSDDEQAAQPGPRDAG